MKLPTFLIKQKKKEQSIKQIFKKIYISLFSFSPFEKYQITQESMIPLFYPGENVLVNKLAYFFQNPKIGDVIIIKTRSRKRLIKRIEKISSEKIYVIGENKIKSIDSRRFGPILKKEIIGKVISKF